MKWLRSLVQGKRERKLERFSLVTLLVVELCALIIYLIRAFKSLRYPYFLDNVEGFLLDQIYTFPDLAQLYPLNFSTQPLLPAAYPPFYHFLLAPVYSFTEPNFLIGRLFSIISFLLLITCIYFFIRSFYFYTKAKSAAFSLLLISSPFFLIWTQIMRVDTTGLLFAFSGLYFSLKSTHGKNKNIYLGIGFILLVFATLTRQSYMLAAPLTVGFFFFLKKLRQRAAIFIFSYYAVVFLLFTLLQHLSNGGFLFNIVTINRVMLFELSRVVGFFTYFGLMHFLLIVSLILFACFSYLKKEFKLTPFRASIFLYFFLGLVSAVTVGKVGSSINYFLEAIVGLLLVLVDLAKTNSSSKDTSTMYILLSFHVLFFISFSLFQRHFMQVDLEYFRNSLIVYDNTEEYKTITSLVESPAIEVLSDTYSSNLVLLGKDPYIESFAMKELYYAELWDQKVLHQDVTQQKFDYILVDFWEPEAWWTQETLNLINEFYISEQIEGVVNYVVFVPKN